MSLIRSAIWSILTASIFLFGCQSGDRPLENAPEGGAGAVTSFEVNLLNEVQLTRFIENREGRILFINVWATWCIPCREEFPDLVKLADHYKDRNIDFVAISADYPDEIESKIIPFLEEQQVNFPVYVQNFGRQEDFINYLNMDWSGALPATFIYDTAGEQKVFLLGKQSYPDFAAALDKELNW
jgi:thiol-disulfide isomerase/thioredoxin